VKTSVKNKYLQYISSTNREINL